MPKKQVVASTWRASMRDLISRAELTAAADVYDRAIEEGASPSPDDDLLRAQLLLKHDENRAVAFLIRRPPRSSGGQQRGRWELWLAVGYARMRDFERADHHFGLAKRLITAAEDRAMLAYQTARRLMLEGK